MDKDYCNLQNVTTFFTVKLELSRKYNQKSKPLTKNKMFLPAASCIINKLGNFQYR